MVLRNESIVENGDRHGEEIAKTKAPSLISSYEYKQDETVRNNTEIRITKV